MPEKKHYQHYIDSIPGDLPEWHGVKPHSPTKSGAGVSRRSLSKARVPLPGWVDLLEYLCEWALQKSKLDLRTTQDLKQLLEKREFLMVAQELLERLGGQAISDFMSDV